MKTFRILISFFFTFFLFSCSVSLVLSFSPSQTDLQNQGLDDQRSHLLQLDQSLTSSQGFLSRSICNLSQLSIFDVSDNKLSGPIPSCLGSISTLRYLDLPDFATATQLDTLQLSGNKLEGKLTKSLANCTMLKILNVGNNSIYDSFPFWLGKLPALKILILRRNKFYGPIKYLKNDFPVLDVLDIASDNFSGQFSTEFFQASQLRSLIIGENKLEGELPRSLANCRKLEVLDLGKNMILDTFPFWLVKLPSLKVLVLRANRFYGTIKLSEDENRFPMLHILDLASSNFSGELSVEFLQSLRAMMMVIDGNKDGNNCSSRNPTAKSLYFFH